MVSRPVGRGNRLLPLATSPQVSQPRSRPTSQPHHPHNGRSSRSELSEGPSPSRGTSSWRAGLGAGLASPSAAALEDLEPPASHITSEYHVRDEDTGQLLFPSRRPVGDADIPLLERAVGQMLSDWGAQLDRTKPSFPMNSTLWGVMQMIIYDIWCTVEETRIW